MMRQDVGISTAGPGDIHLHPDISAIIGGGAQLPWADFFLSRYIVYKLKIIECWNQGNKYGHEPRARTAGTL
jgi:hypothetical protein